MKFRSEIYRILSLIDAAIWLTPQNYIARHCNMLTSTECCCIKNIRNLSQHTAIYHKSPKFTGSLLSLDIDWCCHLVNSAKLH